MVCRWIGTGLHISNFDVTDCLEPFAVRSNRKRLTWSRRISAAIGVAKGIQFLHTGIVPGVFTNNLKITDILLDQNLVAKIGSHNLPIIAQNMGKV